MTAHHHGADSSGPAPDDAPTLRLSGGAGMTVGRTVVFISSLYFLSLLVQALTCCRSRGGRFDRLSARSQDALWRLEYGDRAGRTSG